MLAIRTLRPHSNEFAIEPSGSSSWPKRVPLKERARLKQASNADGLFASGRVLANLLTPPRGGIPDFGRLRDCLQAESWLDTNEPSTPWELIAWNDDTMVRHYWGTKKPVVRAYGQPVVEANQSIEWQLRSRLVVASDPDGDLKLLSKHEDQIKALVARDPQDRILWNQPRAKVIEEIAIERDLVIFIGHSTYNPSHPYRSKYYLSNGEFLTPDDLLQHLSGRPVVLLLACGTGQYVTQDRGPAAMPAMGFMPACLDKGATAFIGPLWDIKVDGGLWVAKHFLQHIQSHPPGEALRLTRLDALQPRDPFPDMAWASFVVYQRPHLVKDTVGDPSDEEKLWKKAIEQYERKDFLGALKTLAHLERRLKSKVGST